MIARPVHRPRPIPFDAPSPASPSPTTDLGQAPRAVSWAAALGPGAPAPAIPHAHTPTRLSPVKAPLPFGPGLHAAQPAARGLASATATDTPRATAASNAHVGGPRHHQGSAGPGHSMTEISARYIGHGALSVRSSVTGRHYRFQGHGDSVVIDRNDIVLLKRISDLVIR